VTARGIDLKSLTRKSKKGDWSFFKDKPTSRSDRRRIINEAWVLPRPRKTKYKGGFPLHFEKKIIRRMGLTPNDLILHPFGGAAEYGLRFDIRRETRPDIQCDAHFLPVRDRALDGVILDPPYDDALAETLYDTAKLRPLKYSQFVREAVRVLKPGGMLVVYHYVTTPRVDGTDLIRRVFLETRAWHRLRSVKIHRKHGVNSTVQGRLMEEAKA
jgi:DNA modification methylase